GVRHREAPKAAHHQGRACRWLPMARWIAPSELKYIGSITWGDARTSLCPRLVWFGPSALPSEGSRKKWVMLRVLYRFRTLVPKAPEDRRTPRRTRLSRRYPTRTARFL